MSGFGDNNREMNARGLFDEDTVEALLAREPLTADLGPLTTFVHALDSVADEPAPAPSAALAVLLTEGFVPDEIDPTAGRG